jgi:hypothetical protein
MTSAENGDCCVSIPLIRTSKVLNPKRSSAMHTQTIRPSSRRVTLAPPAQGGFRRAPKASERRGRCSVRSLFAGRETAKSKVRSLAHGTGELGMELSPKGSITRWVVLPEGPSFRRRASRRKSRGLVQLLCPRPGKTNAKRGACKRRRCVEQRHTSELPGANHAPRLPREGSECFELRRQRAGVRCRARGEAWAVCDLGHSRGQALAPSERRLQRNGAGLRLAARKNVKGIPE